MNIDDELRGTMQRHADDAPSAAGMLDAVRVRSRRYERGRQAGLVGVVVLAGVAVTAGTPYALGEFRHPGPAPALPVGQPAISTPTHAPASPSRSARPARQSTVALTPGFTPLAFPLTPTVTLPGLDAPTVGRAVGEVRLVYNGQSAGLIVRVVEQLPQGDFTPASTQPSTVGGRPATLTTGTDTDGPAARLTWQLPDGRWVDVRGTGSIGPTQVHQYAEGLRVQQLPPPALPFKLTLAPQGFQVAFQEIDPTEFHLCLAPAADVNDEGPSWVCLSGGANGLQSGGDPVQVGPDPGQIDYGTDNITLTVLRPGFTFTVIEGLNGPLNEDDLIRYAASIDKG